MTIITEKEVNSVITKLNKVTTLRRLKPLSVAETTIIKGLLEGQSYEDIAKGAFYTRQYVQTSASKLLRLLSAHYKEDINPGNILLVFKVRLLTSRTREKKIEDRSPSYKLNNSEVLFFAKKISDIVFEETGHHLLNTEYSALRGVLTGVTYRESASLFSHPQFTSDYYSRLSCRIFNILSKRFGVKFKKYNFVCMCERYLSD